MPRFSALTAGQPLDLSCNNATSVAGTQAADVRRGANRPGMKKLHVCGVCSKDFRCRSDLAQHMNVHDKIKKFLCRMDGCHKEYTQAASLWRHQRFKHTNHPGFSCTECRTICIWPDNLRKHMKKNHLETVFGSGQPAAAKLPAPAPAPALVLASPPAQNAAPAQIRPQVADSSISDIERSIVLPTAPEPVLPMQGASQLEPQASRASSALPIPSSTAAVSYPAPSDVGAVPAGPGQPVTVQEVSSSKRRHTDREEASAPGAQGVSRHRKAWAQWQASQASQPR